jgi:lysophospholipase L1-like esterase
MADTRGGRIDPVSNPRPRLAVFAESLRLHPKRLVIISEGDSWFSYPLNRNIADYIEMMSDFSMLRLEHSGDEAREVLGAGSDQIKDLRKYLKRYPAELLLFSGGGNDIADENLPGLLNSRTPGMTWRDCINDAALAARLDEIVAAYQRLIDARDTYRKTCHIVTHCYDYPVPNGIPAKGPFGLGHAGPWLKPRLVQMGINPATDGVPILRHLIDQFHDRLQALAAPVKNKFHVVDTRGTLTPNDPLQWADEMHPSGVGAGLLAQRWRAALAAIFPGRGF